MTEAMQRRTVLAGSGIVLASLAVAACSSNASSATSSAPAASPSDGSPVTDAAGGGSVLTPTSAVAVGSGVVISAPPIVVTQPTAGHFNGFSAICPHQGCLVSSVENNEIICPCHGSRFSATDGSVINGPAEVGLSAAAVVVQGSNVVLA